MAGVSPAAPVVSNSVVSSSAVELSCAGLTVRAINAALRELPDGTAVRLTEARGQHNLAVGLSARLAAMLGAPCYRLDELEAGAGLAAMARQLTRGRAA